MADVLAFDAEDNLVSTLSDNDNRKLAASISKRFAKATDDIRTLIEDSQEGWDFYLNNQPDTSKALRPGTSLDTRNIQPNRGLRLGLIPRSVDSVLAILHSAIFPADERFFRGTPQSDMACKHQELYEQFRADNFAEKALSEEMRKFLLCLEIDSAAALAVHWKQEKKDKISYAPPTVSLGGMTLPIPGFGVKKKIQRNAVTWEGTVVECLDFNDWRVDPYAKRFEDSWFIRRWYVPTWKVEEDYGVSDVQPYHDAVGSEDPNGNKQLESFGLVLPIPLEDEEDGKEQALLMICYDDFVINGKVYKNHAALTLNGKEVIWFGPNGYDHGRIPYIVHSLLPVPNTTYGLSLIKHAIPSASVVDSATEKILKIGALAAEPIFEVDMMEPAFRKSRAVKAGMTIPVKRPGAIRQVQVNVANLSILENVIQQAQDNVREVTGASPVFTGENFDQQPANITAFQVGQHVQGATTRFQAMITNFNNKVLDPLMFMALENDKQFKEKTEYIAVGDDTRELTPDMIKQMDFKWLLMGAQAAMARGQKLANLKSWITEILPPLVQFGVVRLLPEPLVADQYAALRDFLITAGMQNADELLKLQPQEVPPSGLQQPNPPGPGQPPMPAPVQPSLPPPPVPVPGPMPPGPNVEGQGPGT